MVCLIVIFYIIVGIYLVLHVISTLLWYDVGFCISVLNYIVYSTGYSNLTVST